MKQNPGLALRVWSLHKPEQDIVHLPRVVYIDEEAGPDRLDTFIIR